MFTSNHSLVHIRRAPVGLPHQGIYKDTLTHIEDVWNTIVPSMAAFIIKVVAFPDPTTQGDTSDDSIQALQQDSNPLNAPLELLLSDDNTTSKKIYHRHHQYQYHQYGNRKFRTTIRRSVIAPMVRLAHSKSMISIIAVMVSVSEHVLAIDYSRRTSSELVAAPGRLSLVMPFIFSPPFGRSQEVELGHGF